TASSGQASPFLVLPCPCLRLPPRPGPALPALASLRGYVAAVLPAAAVRPATRPPACLPHTAHLPRRRSLPLSATSGAPPHAAVVPAPSSVGSSLPCACSRSPSACCPSIATRPSFIAPNSSAIRSTC